VKKRWLICSDLWIPVFELYNFASYFGALPVDAFRLLAYEFIDQIYNLADNFFVICLNQRRDLRHRNRRLHPAYKILGPRNYLRSPIGHRF